MIYAALGIFLLCSVAPRMGRGRNVYLGTKLRGWGVEKLIVEKLRKLLPHKWGAIHLVRLALRLC